MRYFVIITLLFCMVGVSLVFAGQSQVSTANRVAVSKTIVQSNSPIHFLMNLPANTIKYLIPIESLLSLIPFLGVFFSSIALVQLSILLLPVWIIIMIFNGGLL